MALISAMQDVRNGNSEASAAKEYDISRSTLRKRLKLDGHVSHKSLQVILNAREYGIHLLTFPPHTSHTYVAASGQVTF